MAKSAIVFGVGASRGLGAALVRRFAREGYHVVVTGRTADKLSIIVDEIKSIGFSASTGVVDVTTGAGLGDAFDDAQKSGTLEAVLYNVGNNAIIPFMDLEADTFEAFWRVGCLGGFLVGQEAVRRMLPAGRGSILYTGASGSLRGRVNFAHFASAKAGLRAMVQSMAREFGPQGLHVGHVVIDGVIDGDMVRSRFNDYIESKGDDGALAPDAIADAFWSVHCQPRSAWTQEIDLRPWVENW
ncbi:MAG: SDR family NAD(P)-dependent oxidoreductase [Parvularculales bacterium]